jgi:hypothetical protein
MDDYIFFFQRLYMHRRERLGVYCNHIKDGVEPGQAFIWAWFGVYVNF